MLLRRITKHVTDQNWFAVFIDFLIVIFGVYIGLQVQQWAVERDRANSEVNYIERLHEEVVRAIDVRHPLVEERTNNRKLLGSAHRVLFRKLDRENLNGAECEAITEAYIFSNITADLPTTAELISAGNLDAIRSKEVRSMLISLNQTLERARDIVAGVNVNSVTLHQAYPELIKLGAVDNGTDFGEASFVAECDTENMRFNPRFLNDFVDSHFRYLDYEAGAVQRVSLALAKLHDLIDKELSITHENKEIEE